MAEVESIRAKNTFPQRARGNGGRQLRVAAYCRVSTDSEDQLSSYRSQVAHYTELIERTADADC